MKIIQKVAFCALFLLGANVFASNTIPMGHDNNALYYKIGGGSDFRLPPVSGNDTILLKTNTNLGLPSCNQINPALSIMNSMNDLKSVTDNISKDFITHATGSLIELPMYLLASRNPALYNIINNALLSAHEKLDVSTKSCEMVKSQIASGQNPYQDWATIAVNDQWKQKLSVGSANKTDINAVKKEIDASSGNDGVPWVNGDKDKHGIIHAGGAGNQPAVHVIADTMKAGYNAMLNRDIQAENNVDKNGSGAELASYFPNPRAASNWMTSVVGDHDITTCNDSSCLSKQGSTVGRGLLPWVTNCSSDNKDCVGTIRDDLGKLVTGNEAITRSNLDKVSAEGIAMSPDAIANIRLMDTTQQGIIVNKLAQEIAVQRVIDKALMARNILSTGAQIPVIAANHPAQVIIEQSIKHLDEDIHSLAFEKEIRKEMMSGTLSEVMNFGSEQQRHAMNSSPILSSPSVIEDSAISKKSEKK